MQQQKSWLIHSIILILATTLSQLPLNEAVYASPHADGKLIQHNKSTDRIASLSDQRRWRASVDSDGWGNNHLQNAIDKPIWHDEFTGRANTLPNPHNWSAYVGGDGWGNKQLEYDTNNKNVYVNGHGQLVLEARKENPAHYQCWYGSCRYTGARLNTKFAAQFTYGRFEARIKMPFGQGIWPAFWLLGGNIATGVKWPACGEIDAMENIGREPSIVHGTIHGPGYGSKGIGKLYTLSPARFSNAYHIFAVRWDSALIRFFVDGKNYFTLDHKTVTKYGKWVFDHPFFILLDIEVGGLWPGSPNSTTIFPQKMLVDYVRVYK